MLGRIMFSQVARFSSVIILSLSIPHLLEATMTVYKPLSVHLRQADFCLTAVIKTIVKEDTIRFALARSLEILKGEFSTDSVLKLPFYEIHPGVTRLTPEIKYDSGATYLLLFKKNNDRLDRISMPTKITDANKSIIEETKELLNIELINQASQRALSYTNLLKSSCTDIRESAAWELGEAECREALNGLLIALEDTTYWVRQNALKGLISLGEKDLTSDTVVSALKHYLRYSLETYMLLKALAAQGGDSVLPYLRNYFRFCDQGKESVLETFAYLKDTTAIGYFREAILYDLWRELRKTAVRNLDYFPARIAVSTAIEALDDRNEYVRDIAIEVLEVLTDNHFGRVDTIRHYMDREPMRKEIIEKWKEWYEDWRKEQID